MDRTSYRRGFEDAIEVVKALLRANKLLSDKINEILDDLLIGVKDDKIASILRELGLN
jgi:hypothetical protein